MEKNLEFCFKMNVIQLKDFFFPCAIMVSRCDSLKAPVVAVATILVLLINVRFL